MVIPPVSHERYWYVDAKRRQLYLLGIITVLPLMIGMVLLILAHPYFLVFIPFAAVTIFYLLVSYVVGIFGKDFDLKAHKETVAHFSVLSMPPEERPEVDIYYPVCGENLEVIQNALGYIVDLAMAYGPKAKLYMLDDSKDMGGHKAFESSRHRLSRDHFFYVRREVPGEDKKSGNLRNIFKQTSGQFIAIFDADFCPNSDFLFETIPWMRANDNIAIVQTPQFFRVEDHETWIGKGASYVQELFYRLIQVNRDTFNGAICVGTNALYRRRDLIPFGGTALIPYSEDVRTGFNCLKLGRTIKYLPLNMAKGLCPDLLPSFLLQQHRWSLGSISLFFHEDFWITKLSFMQRVCYMSGMFYYMATGLSLFFGYLPVLLLLTFKPEGILWYSFAFSVPSLLFGTAYQAYWSRGKWGIYVMKSRIVSYHAHLFGLVEFLTKSVTPWQPTGNTTKTKLYTRFQLFLFWGLWANIGIMMAIAYRMSEFNWYNFLPSLFFVSLDLYLKGSILRDQI